MNENETKTAGTTRHEVLMWDWKDSVDVEQLNDAIKAVFDGKNAPRVYSVDTGQDCYAIVVASTEMTQEQVQTAWMAGDDD